MAGFWISIFEGLNLFQNLEFVEQSGEDALKESTYTFLLHPHTPNCILHLNLHQKFNLKSSPDTRGWRRPFARIFLCGAGGAGGAGRPSCSPWRAPPRCSSTPPTQASVVGCAEGQSSPSRSLPHHTLMLLDPLDPLTRTMLVARRRHSDVLRRPRRVAAAQPPLAEIPSSIIAILLTLIAGHACAELNATSVFAAIDSRSAAHTRSSLAERPSASRRRSRRGR